MKGHLNRGEPDEFEDISFHLLGLDLYGSLICALRLTAKYPDRPDELLPHESPSRTYASLLPQLRLRSMPHAEPSRLVVRGDHQSRELIDALNWRMQFGKPHWTKAHTS
jgi:hypothetical protein